MKVSATNLAGIWIEFIDLSFQVISHYTIHASNIVIITTRMRNLGINNGNASSEKFRQKLLIFPSVSNKKNYFTFIDQKIKMFWKWISDITTCQDFPPALLLHSSLEYQKCIVRKIINLLQLTADCVAYFPLVPAVYVQTWIKARISIFFFFHSRHDSLFPHSQYSVHYHTCKICNILIV